MSDNVTMLVPVAAAAELVAMSATDANSNDDRTAVDVVEDVAVAAAVVDEDDDGDNPSYPASAISPLSTI